MCAEPDDRHVHVSEDHKILSFWLPASLPQLACSCVAFAGELSAILADAVLERASGSEAAAALVLEQDDAILPGASAHDAENFGPGTSTPRGEPSGAEAWEWGTDLSDGLQLDWLPAGGFARPWPSKCPYHHPTFVPALLQRLLNNDNKKSNNKSNDNHNNFTNIIYNINNTNI